MVKAEFEHEGNIGLLSITTHFGRSVKIPCLKRDGETFKLGGTAVNEVAVYEGVITSFLVKAPESRAPSVRFRAFFNEENSFEDVAYLSPEPWSRADLHCYVTEHYTLDMEGKRPSWFVSHKPFADPQYLFVNLDVIDGGGNILKRYRVSPFTGDHVVLDG